MRIVVFGIVAVLGLLVTATVASAQTDVSVDEDEMAFVGEVPVPRGATVTIEYLDVPTATGVECGRSTSTDGSGEVSNFVLIVQRDCAEDRQDPRICWGEGACAFPDFDDMSLTDFEGSAVRDVGRLEAREAEEPSAPSTGGSGPIELAHAGSHGGGSHDSWLLWMAIGALAAGAVFGGAGLVLRKR